MTEYKRPISITILGCLYLAVGIGGFALHFKELLAGNPFQNDAIWVELTELVAVVCGAFLLKGQNWARWLAIAWMAFHVALSAFGRFTELAVHCLFLIVIAWILFRPAAARYFRRVRERA